MTNDPATDGKSGTELPRGSRRGPKEAYQHPHLIVYGNIREITKAVGVTGAKDGGGGAMQKTRP